MKKLMGFLPQHNRLQGPKRHRREQNWQKVSKLGEFPVLKVDSKRNDKAKTQRNTESDMSDT
jgi:hypothetical protein